MIKVLLFMISITTVSPLHIMASEFPYVILDASDWQNIVAKELEDKTSKIVVTKDESQENSCWSFLEWICIPYKKSDYLTGQ